MGKVILVTGGSRSGKSTFALEKALQYESKRVFLATAVPFDDEMRDRISKHREERQEQFETIEHPCYLARALASVTNANVVLLDCLTIYLSNSMFTFENNKKAFHDELDSLINSLGTHPFDLIAVTNEVGCGIVPENKLAREFRDHAGWLNQAFAKKADEVYLCACGLPLQLKNRK